MELELLNKIKISIEETDEFNEEFAKFKDYLENNHLNDVEIVKLLVLTNLISDINIYSKLTDHWWPIKIPFTKTGLLRLILLQHPKDYVRVNGKGEESLKSVSGEINNLSQVVWHYSIENPLG